MLRAAPGLVGEAPVSVAAPQTQMLTTEALVVVAGLESAPGARVAAASAALESGRRLLLAARSGDTATVRSLLAAGAPFTADWLGTSPLHLAAANNHLETVEVLLRAGVSRDARSKVERTPLHVAASAGHAAVVAALLAHGANVECRDMLGMTPLHWAAERGHTAAARVLLVHGADATVTSKFLKTPLALAARSPAMRVLFDAELAARALRQEQQQHQQQQQQKQQQEEQPKQYKEHTLEELTNIPLETNTAKLQKTPEKKCIKVKLVNSQQYDAKAFPKTDASAGEAAALLQRHGITLLPHDPGSTVLSALQCGRTVVLSDAGKLMLKESVSPGSAGGAGRAREEEEGAAVSPAPSPSKVLKKVSPPHCQRLSTQKVKLIAGAQGRQVVARPLQPVRLKVRARGSAGGAGGGVRLLMDRASLQRLVQGADEVATAQPEIHTKSNLEEEGSEVGRLRAELAVARATIAQLRRQLAAHQAPAQ